MFTVDVKLQHNDNNKSVIELISKQKSGLPVFLTRIFRFCGYWEKCDTLKEIIKKCDGMPTYGLRITWHQKLNANTLIRLWKCAGWTGSNDASTLIYIIYIRCSAKWWKLVENRNSILPWIHNRYSMNVCPPLKGQKCSQQNLRSQNI